MLTSAKIICVQLGDLLYIKITSFCANVIVLVSYLFIIIFSFYLPVLGLYIHLGTRIIMSLINYFLNTNPYSIIV